MGNLRDFYLVSDTGELHQRLTQETSYGVTPASYIVDKSPTPYLCVHVCDHKCRGYKNSSLIVHLIFTDSSDVCRHRSFCQMHAFSPVAQENGPKVKSLVDPKIRQCAIVLALLALRIFRES